MVVKFKLEKTRRQYPRSSSEAEQAESRSLDRDEEKGNEVGENSARQLLPSPVNRKRSADATADDGNVAENPGSELSFILNIFPDGYSIVVPPEIKILAQNPVPYFRKFLRPYDRQSESLITTIECGLVPVNFLDGIECKYVEGKLWCEVRDYRKNSADTGTFNPARAPFPRIIRQSLQMTTDNVVNDLHLITDSTWTHQDMLEAEARILCAIQPKLDLDPTPNFERLCRKPKSVTLNLDIRGLRLKRLRQSSAPERSARGQPDFVNTVSTSPGNHAPNAFFPSASSVSSESSYQIGVENPGHVQDGQMFSMVNSNKDSWVNPMANDGNQSFNHSLNAREAVPGISVTRQPDFVNTLSPSPNASSSACFQTGYQIGFENPGNMQDGLLSSVVISDKRSRLNPMVLDANQSLNHGTKACESVPGSSVTGQLDFVNTISTRLENYAPNASTAASSTVPFQSSYQIGVGNQPYMQDGHISSMVISDTGSRLNPTALDGNQSLNHGINARESIPVQQQSTVQQILNGTINYNIKQEPVETERINSLPQQFTRANFLQAPWNNMSSNAAVSLGPFQSSYQIGVENPQHLQDGLLSSMINSDGGSWSNPIAIDGYEPFNQGINARKSVPGSSVKDQLDFVNTISTSLRNDAPNLPNAASSSVSFQPSYQIGDENPRHMQDGLLSSMISTDEGSWLNPIALDGYQSLGQNINASVMGQPDFVTSISTNPIDYALNSSVAASSSLSCQSSYQIGVENAGHMQDGLLSSMVISDSRSPVNPLAPDAFQSLNQSITEHSVMGQPDFVNTISTSLGNHAPKASTFSSVSSQPSYQIGVGNPPYMQAGQISSTVISNMGSRLNPTALVGNQSLNPSINARESIPVQQQSTAQQIHNGTLNYNIKQEPVETERINSLPQQFTRANFQQAPWNNMSPTLENKTIKQEVVSEPTGLLIGEGVTSVPVARGTSSLTSNVNESTQQAQMTANSRSNSLVGSGAGSPASFSNPGSRIGRPPSGAIDLHLRDRFSKIQLLNSRIKLDSKTTKTDNIKPTRTWPSKPFMRVLFYEHTNEQTNETAKKENEICEMPLSMSFVGGNVNFCKTRIIKFVKTEPMLPGNGFLLIPKYQTRLILSEKQSDGTVAMHYGELDDCDYLAEDVYLPTFPNTRSADLFASQFCSLMVNDGYRIESDNINSKPVSTDKSTGGQPYGLFTDTMIQQFQASISGELPIGLNSDQDHIPDIPMPTQLNGLLPSSTSQLNPVRQNSPLGNLRTPHGKSPMSIIRPGSPISNAINRKKHGRLLPATAAAANVTSTRNRLAERGMNVAGGFGTQITNTGANRQIPPGSGSAGISTLGSRMTRANDMNSMQRNVMGPPRSIPGMNQSQNQNQHVNQQQMHFIKKEPTSQFRTVAFPVQQIGSPSQSLGMLQQQQQSSSRQMSQLNQVSPQVTSGVIHSSMNAGNQDGGNPQIRSRTFGPGNTMNYTRK